MTKLERARRILRGPIFIIRDGLIFGRNILASQAMDGHPAHWPRKHCGQCGKTFRAKPCGFSHAEIGGWRPRGTRKGTR